MKEKVSALGLDVGRRRVGIAGCDGTGLIATGITTLHRTYFAEDIRKLQEIVDERDIKILVVGLPYSMDGSLGKQAKQVQKFTQKVSAALNLPVDYVDERLTSVEAEIQLKAQKKFSTYDKGLIDKQAAKIILQQWLDMRRQNISNS